jgi:hypothetical protein
MSLTEDEKKNILHSVLEMIEWISDKEFQRRVWIRAEGPEQIDFTETVNCFFDDIDPVLKKNHEYKMSDKEYKTLKHFRDEFDAFSSKNDFADEFIDTPEWDRIVNMAKEVLVVFDYDNKWKGKKFI